MNVAQALGAGRSAARRPSCGARVARARLLHELSARDARDDRQGDDRRGAARARRSARPNSRGGDPMISQTSVPEAGRVRAGQPRVRALVPGADGARGAGAGEAAHRDLPARRGRRPEHDRAARRSGVLPRSARRSRSPGPARAPRRRSTSTGSSGCNPRLQPLKPLWDRARARDRARVRLARCDAVALRRAGLHGNGHAGCEEHRATAG